MGACVFSFGRRHAAGSSLDVSTKDTERPTCFVLESKPTVATGAWAFILPPVVGFGFRFRFVWGGLDNDIAVIHSFDPDFFIGFLWGMSVHCVLECAAELLALRYELLS